ncbi:MAG: cob(I)yrinic acid a,c-diamide adenosyltransferase [Spirochaetales bacterium]|jgi:cob(I)alamin adenosyltransferase|nr:cob(I)yrinic acid a,c-diamide adenosyltransferase [Spirochaetales bacterium]
MIEFEQVTTRGGDGGESSLYNGERLRKDDVLFVTLGDIDELSSLIGLAKATIRMEYPKEKKIPDVLDSIQGVLIRVGGQVATPEKDPIYDKLSVVTVQDVKRLEKTEKQFLKNLEIKGEFILPGATRAGAFLDIARAVCRRAERDVVTCIRDKYRGKLATCQNYLNRLSDLLFVLARWLEG